MQYSSHSSYAGSHQPQSNAYTSSQYYASGPSYGYSTQFSTPQSHAVGGGYGDYNAASALQNTQSTDYGSSSGSDDSPRGSKRARIDDGHDNSTPSRTSGSWGNPQQYYNEQPRGLPLPPMPPPSSPSESNTRQSVQDDRNYAPQQQAQHDTSSQLEQQVRGLADYNQPSSSQHVNPSSMQQQGPTDASPGAARSQQQRNATQYNLPQRGAREGNMLNLACKMCMKKKRKCSKNFPCSECVHHEEQCVPSVRKQRFSAATAGTVQDHPQDEAQEIEYEVDDTTKKRIVRDHTDPNRKYLLTLPKVVNGYQKWSNMRLKYNPMPDDVDEVREKLFKLEKPMLLNSQQYADYWPHVSNIYARGVGPTMAKNGTQLETWECRNQRRQSRHQRIKGSSGQGKRKRERKIHLLEGTEMCKLRFRIVAWIRHADSNEDHKKGLGNCNCVPEWMYIEKMQASANLSHNHTLESLDKYKRTDALLHFCEQKVMEGGYLYKAVCKWMKEKYGHVKELEFLNDHDVANAARRWRVYNRDLELVDTIPDPKPEDERRDKCLKLIETATVEGLQKALREICSKLPEATEIVVPILESSQRPDIEFDDGPTKILEGDDIIIPAPGLPLYKMYGISNTPMPKLGEAHQPVKDSNELQFRIIQGPAPPEQDQAQASPNQAMPSNGALPNGTSPNGPAQHPNTPHQALPPPPLPAQSQLPLLNPDRPPTFASMPPPFQPYQPKRAIPPLSPSSGGDSVVSGGHRMHVPSSGSKVSAPGPLPSIPRPSWAKPGKNDSVGAKGEQKLKENEETDDQRVQRQLEAELNAS